MNIVGSQLREKRESMNLTVDDIVSSTKIQKIYIDAIEKGDFSFFENQDFYQQVFVGTYAEFLGFNKGIILSELQDDAKTYRSQSQFPRSEIVPPPSKQVEVQNVPVDATPVVTPVQEENIAPTQENVSVPVQKNVAPVYSNMETVQPNIDSSMQENVQTNINSFASENVMQKNSMYNQEQPTIIQDDIIIPLQDENKDPLEEPQDVLLYNLNTTQNNEEIQQEEVEQPQDENKGNGPAQMDPEVVKKYLQDYNVKTLPDNPAELQVRLNNDQTYQEPVQEPNEIFQTQPPLQVQPADFNSDLNTNDSNLEQLVNEANNNIDESVNSSDILITPEIMKPEPQEELLNSSIFDDIEKINTQVEETKQDIAPDVIETSEQLQSRVDYNSNPLDPTSVIDLTSGIEIETVSNDSMKREPTITTVPTPPVSTETIPENNINTENNLREPQSSFNENANLGNINFNPFEPISNVNEGMQQPISNVNDDVQQPIINESAQVDSNNMMSQNQNNYSNELHTDSIGEATQPLDTAVNPTQFSSFDSINLNDEISNNNTDNSNDPFLNFIPKSVDGSDVNQMSNDDFSQSHNQQDFNSINDVNTMSETDGFTSLNDTVNESESFNPTDSLGIHDMQGMNDSVHASESNISSLNVANENLDKTAMDVKVSRALGETKIEEKDAKKIKADRIIDILLLAIIICLIVFLVWLTITQLNII